MISITDLAVARHQAVRRLHQAAPHQVAPHQAVHPVPRRHHPALLPARARHRPAPVAVRRAVPALRVLPVLLRRAVRVHPAVLLRVPVAQALQAVHLAAALRRRAVVPHLHPVRRAQVRVICRW